MSKLIDAVLKILASPTFPSMNGQHQRFRKGAPAEPWIEQAKAKLKAAGVPVGSKGSVPYLRFQSRLETEGIKATPRDFHDALLMAIGVTSYRTK